MMNLMCKSVDFNLAAVKVHGETLVVRVVYQGRRGN